MFSIKFGGLCNTYVSYHAAEFVYAFRHFTEIDVRSFNLKNSHLYQMDVKVQQIFLKIWTVLFWVKVLFSSLAQLMMSSSETPIIKTQTTTQLHNKGDHNQHFIMILVAFVARKQHLLGKGLLTLSPQITNIKPPLAMGKCVYLRGSCCHWN